MRLAGDAQHHINRVLIHTRGKVCDRGCARTHAEFREIAQASFIRVQQIALKTHKGANGCHHLGPFELPGGQAIGAQGDARVIMPCLEHASQFKRFGIHIHYMARGMQDPNRPGG